MEEHTAIPLSVDHVRTVLNSFKLGLEIIHFSSTTFTSLDAARAIGCNLGQIAKSMCLMAAGEPVLVVASGDRRLAEAKLAKFLDVGRKKIKIATPEQCVAIFGYPPGGVSPVGHRRSDIPILIDESLLRWDVVYAAAGTSNDNFGVNPEQLVVITGGTVLDCTIEQKRPTESAVMNTKGNLDISGEKPIRTGEDNV
jgi:prolyl-tRNA editing enzyme YbaK/EbsC (Cys-tRNA(Pro) deacylase)